MKYSLDGYRKHLREKMAVTRPGAGRIIEMQWQSAPWIILILIAGVICWAFDLSGWQTLWFTAPLGMVTLWGMGLVAWIFVVEGTRLDFQRLNDKNRS